jgi:phage terminase small subunit
MTKLTPKQAMFVKEYVKDLNAKQAAIRAGYSEKTAKEIGCENLTKPNVAEAVRLEMEKRTEAVEIEADFILKGIRDIAVNGEEQTKDRLKAYELLGKYKKLFTDKVESEVSGDINIQLNVPRPKE